MVEELLCAYGHVATSVHPESDRYLGVVETVVFLCNKSG